MLLLKLLEKVMPQLAMAIIVDQKNIVDILRSILIFHFQFMIEYIKNS